MNICCCGAQAGYPHGKDCPYPLYHCSDEQYERWDEAREALADRLADMPGEQRYHEED